LIAHELTLMADVVRKVERVSGEAGASRVTAVRL
jgi:Zn finger protein HypA/HybF involved in hydrogenase expression